MRTKRYAPLANAGQLVKEVDLGAQKVSASDVLAVSTFRFAPALSLKGIHVPVLAPLVDEDVPGSPPEPVFDSAAQSDIQGNIIPGFNKDHQHFLFLRIRQPKGAKQFLRDILPRISTMEEVMAFRRLYRSKRFLLGRHNTYLCSTWVNIAFSRRGIERLVSKTDADAFGDRSFQLGLAQRSSYLGDPTSPSHRGSPRKWKVGGPNNEADIVVVLASDHAGVLDDLVPIVKLHAHAAALALVFEQRGDTLPGDLRGHEHFGFKDGISQPGIRGKLSRRQATSSRLATLPRATTDGSTSPSRGSRSSGRVSSCSANSVRPRKTISTPPGPAPTSRRGRTWLVPGLRRLQQDVPAFWSFVARGSARTGIAKDAVRRDARRAVAERRADPARTQRRRSGARRR